MENKNIILDAYKKKYAIPHFNFDSLQMAKFILEECQRLKSPVFLAVSTNAVKYIGGYLTVKNIVSSLIKDLNITIPVILHLDHAKNIEECIKAIDVGFDSIMLDLSSMPLDENIEGLKKLRDYNKNILLECEVGAIGKNGNEGIMYADINDCLKIKHSVNIDMLAPAIGTVHGLYKGEQNINVSLLEKINETLKIPLVLHGGSETKEEILKNCIKNGIIKVNINTSLKIAWKKGVKEYMDNYPNELDYRKYIQNAEKYIKKTIEEHILLFGSNNKCGE